METTPPPYVAHGLSPRGRGNQPFSRCQSQSPRSIPAWAGQPLEDTIAPPLARVYPRVGGATCAAVGVTASIGGLSPAWAGQPLSPGESTRVSMVYPRVGGATAAKHSGQHTAIGLSPRGRGNRHQHLHGLNATGLSPRGRGNLVAARIKPPFIRSIPAWAGQPSLSRRRLLFHRVYPRVGGATRRRCIGQSRSAGLSPRGRGNLYRTFVALSPYGSIPAWAGQPDTADRLSPRRTVYPRVGGATNFSSSPVTPGQGLSPRGRGNHWT